MRACMCVGSGAVLATYLSDHWHWSVVPLALALAAIRPERSGTSCTSSSHHVRAAVKWGAGIPGAATTICMQQPPHAHSSHHMHAAANICMQQPICAWSSQHKLQQPSYACSSHHRHAAANLCMQQPHMHAAATTYIIYAAANICMQQPPMHAPATICMQQPSYACVHVVTSACILWLLHACSGCCCVCWLPYAPLLACTQDHVHHLCIPSKRPTTHTTTWPHPGISYKIPTRVQGLGF